MGERDGWVRSIIFSMRVDPVAILPERLTTWIYTSTKKNVYSRERVFGEMSPKNYAQNVVYPTKRVWGMQIQDGCRRNSKNVTIT